MKQHNSEISAAIILGEFTCPDPEFCPRGSNSDIVIFLADEGREYPDTTKSRPSSGAI